MKIDQEHSPPLPPVTPGEVLTCEFLEPMGIGRDALARATGLPVSWVSDVIDGRRAVDADTAARLAAFFGTSARLWANLQARHDASLRGTGDR